MIDTVNIVCRIFFKKRGVPVMPVIDLFNFVVDQNIADEDVDAYLEKVSCMFEYKTLPFNLSLLPYLLNVPIMILSA
jgi:hypothetical protein